MSPPPYITDLRVGLNIRPTTVSARMADGRTPLRIEGETEVDFNLNGKVYHMSALVANFTDADILAGTPFMSSNDISIRPAKGQIIIGDQNEIVLYDSKVKSSGSACLITPFDIKVPSRSIILPGESLEVQVPWNDQEVVVEPRFDLSFNSRVKESQMWPSPQFAKVVNGCLNLTNHNEEPVCVKKLERVCKIYQATDANPNPSQVPSPIIPTPSLKKFSLYSSSIDLNSEGVLSNSIETSFKDLVREYDEIFNPTISL